MVLFESMGFKAINGLTPPFHIAIKKFFAMCWLILWLDSKDPSIRSKSTVKKLIAAFYM